jgi:predicted transcriptional regulator
MSAFNDFVTANRGSKVRDDIVERWETRIVPKRLHEMGVLGVGRYMAEFGAGIGAPKCIQLARKAELESCFELALGFWLKAYELETGLHADPADYQTSEENIIASNYQTDKESIMKGIPTRLLEIAELVKSGKSPQRESVRMLLGWFDISRRGVWANELVHKALISVGLRTEPNFEYAYLDGQVEFFPSLLDDTENQSPQRIDPVIPDSKIEVNPINSSQHEIEIMDPTYRIGKLASANRPPVSVKLNAKIEAATSLMLLHDYSQLPIMESEREVKGIVSWESIGSRLALGRPCVNVRDCMDPHHEISAEVSLFSAIDTIVTHEYVLIRDSSKKITGIVTTSDLSLQFRQLGEPFLLLGEIENHIRRFIQNKFTMAELESMKDPLDKGRQIISIYDLTFGEYIRLLQNPLNWLKLKLIIDRNIFIETLNDVRRIRNDVMHFDPDGVAELDLAKLREFVRFLQGLIKLGVM